MKAKLIRHGINYFITQGVYCPDCDEIDFGFESVTDVTHCGGEPEFIIHFRCRKCGCVFTTEEE